MINFFHRKRLCDSGMFKGMVDFHSHILPGVDDGIQTMEESLAALSYMEELGISTLWLTPHIMEDYPNTTADLKAVFEKLKSAYTGRMELHLAAENMIDNLLSERLDKGDLLPIGMNSEMLLVETSFFCPPTGLYAMIDSIRKKGYVPLLAHPERYSYMDEKEYMNLESFGVRFQLNLLSLAGAYGTLAKKKANWFIEKGMVYCYGTDIHNLRSFDEMVHKKY